MVITNVRFRASAICVLASLLLVGVGPALASTCVWTGGGTDNNWSTAANWSCNDPGGPVSRAPVSNDDLKFEDQTARPSPVDDMATLGVLNSITIAGRGANGQAWSITADGQTTVSARVLIVSATLDVNTNNGASFRVPLTLSPGGATVDRFVTNDGPAPLTLGAIVLNGARVNVVANAPITVDGALSGIGPVPLPSHMALVKTGSSTLTLAGDNTFTGDSECDEGTLVVLNSHGLGAAANHFINNASLALANGVEIDQSVRFQGGSLIVPPAASVTLAGTVVADQPSFLQLDGTLTITGPMGQGSTFTQSGGTLILTNPSNSQISLTVDAGTVRVGAAGGMGSAPTITLSHDQTLATLDLNGFDLTLATLAGNIGGRVLLGAQTLTLSPANGVVTNYSGTIAGTGNLVFNGAGRLVIDGSVPNTFTGTTTVSSGTLVLNKTTTNATILGPLTVSGGVVLTSQPDQIADQVPVTSNGSGAFSVSANETIGSLAGTGRVFVESTGTLTVGANNASTTFSGAFVGGAAPAGNPQPETYFRLVKIGTGTLTLPGPESPSDQLVVDAGTLLVDRQSNGSGVLVRGGTFGGTGTILDNDGTNTFTSIISVAGGRLSPGDGGPGTLHGDAAEIKSGGALFVVLNGLDAGAGYSQLALNNSLTLETGATLEISRNFDAPKGSTFTIVQIPSGGTTNGTFAGLPEGATVTAGQRFQITYHGGPNQTDIVLTAVDDPPPPTYYLSEGATGDFFTEDVLIANPNTTDAPVTLTFSKEDGSQVVDTRTVPAQSRMTVHVNQISGLEAVSGVSAQVASTSRVPLVVERSMFWDKTAYAGSTGSSVDRPAQDWFFAEGSQGFFFTFILVNNPNPTPTDVTFTFFLESGQTVTKTITVGATTRLTLYAGDVPQLVNQSFGTSVHATQPIMAERSMYFGTRPDGRVWCGGTESAGVTATSTHWFLAEGATGGFFSTYVLLSNPGDTAANVTVQYLLPSGDTVTSPKTLPAHTRKTTNIGTDEQDVRLKNTAVSTVVTSDQPIIAERSMYWPGAIVPFGEGHNSFGVVEAGLKWGLAEGRTGTPLNYHTYILLANPQTTAANVTVTFLRENGAPVVKTFTVAATSRFNIDSATITELHDENFAAVIAVTNNVPIIVERSLYWDSNGFSFSGGTNATGIRLP